MTYFVNVAKLFLLRHAGRELDVEVLDREFAGDEPEQKLVAGSRKIC